MPDHEYDDDYVAKLLAEDARKTSRKFAAQGISNGIATRRAADAPKPNTRFLTHIVREADSHNTALKRKEEREAHRRLRALRDAEQPAKKRRRLDEDDGARRKRMLKDIAAVTATGSHTKSQRRRAERSAEEFPVQDSGHRRGDERAQDRLGRLERRAQPSITNNQDQRSRSHKTSRGNDHESGEKVSRRRSQHSLSPSRNSDTDRARTRDRPIIVRGRGAHRTHAGIDDRFAKDYDPSMDVTLESSDEGDDWDMALEAMRDRAKYKRNQSARMRDAGFDEKEITQFEKSMSHKTQDSQGDLASVTWSKKGETREWDVDKT